MVAGADHGVTTWRKSSYSGGNGSECVEVATAWRTSSYSAPNGSNCVEVAASSGAAPVILVRDTKNRAAAPLEFTARAWRHFATALRASPGA
jgi:hypothetical protein